MTGAPSTCRGSGNGYEVAVGVPTWIKTTGAVTVTALAGSWAADASSAWYSGLRKPTWQPPARAFPVVWTPLYALIAVAGTRALNRAAGGERAALRRAYGANLVLNAGWTAADASHLAFSADGRQLITLYGATIRFTPCEVCGPIDEVLALAGQRITRDFTPEERAKYLREPE
jgi:tryptophan-rich sensory protein